MRDAQTWVNLNAPHPRQHLVAGDNKLLENKYLVSVSKLKFVNLVVA